MRTVNNNLLRTRINLAYCNRGEKIPKEATIGSALAIFKEIKKMERFAFYGDAKLMRKQELSSAKEDLEFIFGIKPEEIKSLTKNNLYLKHQSLMVNSIYILLKKGEL